MKFSDIDEEQWGELQTYLDTCLLPLTGLTGKEAPWEVTAALERLRNLMDYIEQPFKGRVVTYPAIQYADLQQKFEFIRSVDQICERILLAGFKHVILVTANTELAKLQYGSAHLVIDAESVIGEPTISARIQAMWSSQQAE